MKSGLISRALAFGLLGTACGLCVVGCGGGTGDVSGKVTYNGTPLKGGTVTFSPTGEGPSFTGLINEDGTYSVRGVRAGEYKICVETESLRAKTSGGGGPPGASGQGSGSGSKYGPPGKSGSGAPPAGSGPPGGSGAPDLVKAAESGKLKGAANAPPGGSEEPEDVKSKRGKDGLAVMADNAKKYVQIPAFYAKPESTELTYTATRGPQTFDLVLKNK